ncbi:DNA biosynthesis protein [Photobacterium phosphoreum]|uniref:ATP-binding protein n=1 Tax=Photobacterium phosphoreum TaxID=659 RepID=UPI000D167A7D|nr:ATP-binding protein [Photobacterium phosphoreum]PSW31713.1 DNA biosynthesis protein [Photobacterium phosphoreum]
MNIMQRLAQAMPAHVKPYTYEQMQAIHQRETRELDRNVYEQNQQTRESKALGRSGIKKRHQHCSFDNFVIQSAGQQHAFNESKVFVDNLLNGRTCGGFIFAGTSGTGKNHLACAIANQALQQRRSVVVITVAELMLKFRDTYRQDSATSETALIRFLSNVDLLVIDELGVQHNSNNERVMINRIIDERYTLEKPTGVITNLQSDELITTLGRAAVDRIMEDGKWVTFNWTSFRINKGTQPA